MENYTEFKSLTPELPSAVQKVWNITGCYIESPNASAHEGELEFFLEQLMLSLAKDLSDLTGVDISLAMKQLEYT